MSNRFVTVGISLAFALSLACFTSLSAKAQTHSTTHNEWRIMIDESPSPEFVAKALEDLQKFLEPRATVPTVNWCCLGVGNYGGMHERSELDEDDVPFFRITDDLNENALRVLIGSAGYETAPCLSFWALAGPFGSRQEVAETVGNLIDDRPDYGPIVFKVDSGPHPVFIGNIYSQHPNLDVRSATVVAIPEPASAMLCMYVAVTFGRRRRMA